MATSLPEIDRDIDVRNVVFRSPLGDWELTTCPAPPDLSPLVDNLWSARGRVVYLRETILPTDRVELMFNLGLPHRVVRSAKDSSLFVQAWVSGLQEGPLVVEPQYDTSKHDSHLIAARLYPQGAHRLFGLPMEELTNRVIEIDPDFFPEVDRLWERLAETDSLVARFQLLIRALRRRLDVMAIRPSAKVAWAFEAFRRSEGRIRVGNLCRELDISRKHLSSSFRKEVGLPPKRLARILKFSRVLERIQRSPEIRWAELALDTGYYDQSHFNREFRTFTGTTPREFLRRRTPDGTALLEEAVETAR